MKEVQFCSVSKLREGGGVPFGAKKVSVRVWG